MNIFYKRHTEITNIFSSSLLFLHCFYLIIMCRNLYWLNINHFHGNTAWKVSKYVVISGPCFPVFGLKSPKICVFNPNTGKQGPEITPLLDTFHTVTVTVTVNCSALSKQIFGSISRIFLIVLWNSVCVTSTTSIWSLLKCFSDKKIWDSW